jgi:hypothetical protein
MKRPRRTRYPTADQVRALDHLDVDAAAAHLCVRPSYVRRIRERSDKLGTPVRSRILRLELDPELHDRVRAFAASLSAGEIAAE